MQHPDEIKNAKGSAVIAKLYLKRCQLWQGEDFNHNKSLIKLIENKKESTFIVFPEEGAVFINEWEKENNGDLKVGGNYNLIFIDASWRKARKIWHSLPILHELKCVRLQASAQSNYRIRKIPEQGYVSTIEAIVACLGEIENNSEKYHPLLEVFDKMIDAQIESMGKNKFESHYQNKI